MRNQENNKKKIGEILVEQEVIDQNQLTQALVRQQNSRDKLGQILMELGYITDDQLDEALAIQGEEELISD